MPTGNFASAISHLSADPVIGPLIKRYGPCTLMPREDYFVVLCDSIISQQISVKASEAILGRFVEFFDGRPTPDKVMRTSSEELRTVGVSPQKAGYLLDLSSKFSSGEVAYHNFASMPSSQVIEELVKVKGIGRWTAEMFLIFALNRPDVLPVDDLGIRRAVQLQYGLADLASSGQIRELAQNWSPYETIACWYLWRSLENSP